MWSYDANGTAEFLSSTENYENPALWLASTEQILLLYADI